VQNKFFCGKKAVDFDQRWSLGLSRATINFFSTFHYQTAPRFVSWGDLLSTWPSALLQWRLTFFLDWFIRSNVLFILAYVKLAFTSILRSR